jgi:hypothetical protein
VALNEAISRQLLCHYFAHPNEHPSLTFGIDGTIELEDLIFSLQTCFSSHRALY